MAYTPTAATRSSLLVVKSMSALGSTREWTNRYHVTGPLTPTFAQFQTLADAVVADEAAALEGFITIVRVDWSDASTASSTNLNGDTLYTKSYSTAGGATSGSDGSLIAPSDCAVLLRYTTDARSVKNHAIYLFNYYHGAYHSSTNKDNVGGVQKTGFEEYGDDWLAGFSDGVNTRIRCGPHGAVAQSRSVKTLITHRDFPR